MTMHNEGAAGLSMKVENWDDMSNSFLMTTPDMGTTTAKRELQDRVAGILGEKRRDPFIKPRQI
jgi:hypothetical protein